MSARLQPIPEGVRKEILETSTMRDFSGGWNVVDNQLNMKNKYQPVLDNISRFDDGSLGIRYGCTQYFGEDDFIDANPDITLIPAGDGTAVDNATLNQGNEYDGTLNNPAALCLEGGRVNLTTGKTFSIPYNVFLVKVYPTDTGKFVRNKNPIVRFIFEVSTDGIAWEEVDRTADFDAGVAPLDGYTMQYKSGPSADPYGGPYGFARVQLEYVSGLDELLRIGEVEFYSITSDPLAEGGYIVHMRDFQGQLIVFFSTGKIYRIDDTFTVTIIWSDTIAALLPGAPTGWSTDVDFVSTTQFGGQIIACNGVDKPLLIDLSATPVIQYLQDLATLSNAFTPIGRYCLSINDYVLITGDPLEPSRVHVSATGTSGTWFGDPDPNDATYVDLNKKVHTTEPIVRGIQRFRKQCIVAFDETSVIGTLGVFDETGNHIPDFNDVVAGHGSIAHHSMIDIGNDVLMCDHVGVPSVRRGLFTGEAEPDRVSELVDPEVQKAIGHLQVGTTSKHIHAAWNQYGKEYMLFVPNHDPAETPVAHSTDPFAVAEIGTGRLLVIFPTTHQYHVGDSMTIAGATDFNEFTAAQLNVTHTIVAIPDTADGNILGIVIPDVVATDDPDEQIGGGASVTSVGLFTETIGYIYSTVDTLKIKAWTRFRGWAWTCNARLANGRLVFSDGLGIYLYGSREVPVYRDFINSGNELPIAWEWETPWVDFDKRMNSKTTRYLKVDTTGYADFTAQMFIDQIYRNEDGVLDPTLSMSMQGGSTGGFGKGSQPFGGGRRTKTERLYSWNAKCNVAKLRFSGVTTEALRFISVSLAYARGSIRR